MRTTRRPPRRPATLVVALAAFIAATAGSAQARPPLTGFLARPTEQLALPGDPASGEITPEGDIYTGWAEYELAIGADLRRWDQPTRVLADPSVPDFTSQLRRDGVRYTQTVFTIPVGSTPVAYLSLTATDTSARPAVARAALGIAYTRGATITGFHGVATTAYRYERPATTLADGFYFQLGQAFNPAWTYSHSGRDVRRDGLLLVRGPAGGRWPPSFGNPSDQALHGRDVLTQRLAPGHRVTWSWQIPLRPPAAGPRSDAALAAVSPAAAHHRVVGYWRALQRGMMRVSLPEARVVSTFEANVVQILQSRYRTPSGWAQGVNRLQYQSYWIRDSSVDTVALDQVGLHSAAAQNLAFLAHWQQPDGLYISRTGQQDGVGQGVWELAQHALLTHSGAYARAQLSSVAAAVAWIARASAQDPLGILPPSTIQDDEFLQGAHITGENVWTADGLRCAVELARLAGRSDLVAQWQALDGRFERALKLALAAADRRAGHIPPGLDRAGGVDWGNYWVSYPLPILDPHSGETQSTIRWALDHGREGLATYAYGHALLLHDYLGFPIFQTELEAGRVPAALAGFYAELAHTTAPGYGWEDGPAPFGTRRDILNLAPHGTFAGHFVSMLRDMLVDDGGSGTDLLAGASPAWMRAGDRISVIGAPTRYGAISFTLRVARSGAGATLRWSRGAGSRGSLRWTLPYWARRPRRRERPVGRAVALIGSAGAITVAWSGRSPEVSAARATSALNAAYRTRHRPAPIVPATGW